MTSCTNRHRGRGTTVTSIASTHPATTSPARCGWWSETVRPRRSGWCSTGWTTGRTRRCGCRRCTSWSAPTSNHLRALLGRAAVLLCQPIRDGYRDLPLGTAELAAELPSTAQVDSVAGDPLRRFASVPGDRAPPRRPERGAAGGSVPRPAHRGRRAGRQDGRRRLGRRGRRRGVRRGRRREPGRAGPPGEPAVRRRSVGCVGAQRSSRRAHRQPPRQRRADGVGATGPRRDGCHAVGSRPRAGRCSARRSRRWNPACSRHGTSSPPAGSTGGSTARRSRRATCIEPNCSGTTTIPTSSAWPSSATPTLWTCLVLERRRRGDGDAPRGRACAPRRRVLRRSTSPRRCGVQTVRRTLSALIIGVISTTRGDRSNGATGCI